MSIDPQIISPLYTSEDFVQLNPVTDDGTGIPIESERYIFTPGDYLDPARKDQLVHLRRGGDELLDNPCLRRTHNRFLPKCAITPLEIGGEVLSLDLFPTEGESRRVAMAVKGVPKVESGGRLFPQMFLYPHYPGQLVRDACGAGGESRGIVEITYLRGVGWDTGEAQAIQSIIFPDNWEVPKQLRLVEEQIRKAADANTTTIKDVCGEMLDACDKFRRYATTLVSKQIELVAAGPHPQTRFAYFYTPTARSYAEQLEIKLIASTQETVGAEVVKALAGITNRQLDDRDVQVLSIAVAEAVKQALAQRDSEAEVKPAIIKAKPAKKGTE